MERLQQMLGTLVRILRSKQLKDQREWDKLLVMVAHAVNNSVCVSTGVMRDVRALLDMLYPKVEAEKKHLPDMVRKLQE